MKKRVKEQPKKTCGMCIHEEACFYAAGGCGCITNTDATNCVNFSTLTEFLEKYAPVMGWAKKERSGEEEEHANEL